MDSRRRRSRPFWARVTIHLNLLDVPAATQAAVEAHRRQRLPEGLRMGTYDVTGCADIPTGWCFLHPRARLAVLNQGVWEDFDSTTMNTWCTRQLSALGTDAQPTFVWYDIRDWELSRDLDQLTGL